MTQLSIVYTIDDLALAGGGPSFWVSSLGSQLTELGQSVSVLTSRKSGQRAVLPASPAVHLSFVTEMGPKWNPFRASAFSRGLAQVAGRPILHDHGIWLPSNHAVAGVASRRGLIRVVSPHGALEPWALGYHAWKKWLAWQGYQKVDLRRVDAFHAASQMEASNIRRLGFKQPTAVIPYGVEFPEIPTGTHRRGSSVQPTRAREALFLSRLHPKKGLHELVDAWSCLTP